MTFGTVATVTFFLGQIAAWALSERACPRQTVEPVPDANCTFDGKTLCSWMNADNDQLEWVLKKGWNKTVGIHMSTFWKNEGDTAYLVGPVMCEDEGTTTCLQFRYKMDSQLGVRLSLYLCRNWPTGNCTSNPAWTTTEWFDGKWQAAMIPLKLAGQFQFVIEGKKYEERILVTESDIYLDDIVYTNAPCKSNAPPPGTTVGTARPTDRKAGATTKRVIPYVAIYWPSTKATLTGNYNESAEHVGNMEDDGEKSEAPVESSGVEHAGVQHTAFVAVGVLVLVLIVTTVVVIVVVSRRRLSRNSEGRKNTEAMKYQREDHIVLAVSNELYSVISAAGNNTTQNVINELDTDEPKHLNTKATAGTATTPYRL